MSVLESGRNTSTYHPDYTFNCILRIYQESIYFYDYRISHNIHLAVCHHSNYRICNWIELRWMTGLSFKYNIPFRYFISLFFKIKIDSQVKNFKLFHWFNTKSKWLIFCYECGPTLLTIHDTPIRDYQHGQQRSSHFSYHHWFTTQYYIEYSMYIIF